MSEEIERFSATSGRVIGMAAVVIAIAVAVLALLDSSGERSYATVALASFLAAAAYAAMVRPRVELDASTLVLRNMLETVTVPLVAIESVTVRQVLVVFVGERRFTSPAIGRSRRQLHREGLRTGGGPGAQMMGSLPAMPMPSEKPDSASTSHALFVQERIRARVSDALAREGIAARSAEQAGFAAGIVRRVAVGEIIALTGSLLLFLVLVLV
ncbi:MAG: hypothetical protein WB471_11660 [Nocardioides sp.]